MKKIFYAKAVYGKNEIAAATNVLKKNPLSLMDGTNVKKLEHIVAKFWQKICIDGKFWIFSKSISTCLLKLKKGSEIITPTLTFSTTVAPIYQLGLIPKFVDVEKDKYVADLYQIKKAINKKTKAMFIPNLLGNIPDWDKIKKLCKKKNFFN